MNNPLDVCMLCKRTRSRHYTSPLNLNLYCSPYMTFTKQFKPYPKKPHIVVQRQNDRITYVVYDTRVARVMLGYAFTLHNLSDYWTVITKGVK